MKQITFTLLFIVFSTIIFAQNNERRIALVIGNSDYPGGQALKNPVNDANLMASTLRSLGFFVMKRINVTEHQMEDAIESFSKKLPNYNVALVYYAGHGIQVDGINYIIPIDAKLENKIAVRHEAISVNDVVAEFQYYPNNTNIVILDACRDNPFRSWSRGGARGFKAMKPSSGTIIAFATSEGATASDGNGTYGLYTKQLVKQLKKPQRMVDVFNNTRIAVEYVSNGKQSPQEWTKLKGAFYFKKNTGGTYVNNSKSEKIGYEQGNVVYNYGSISIDSEISGNFYLDGKYLGKITANSSGNKLTKITTGSHTIKIEGGETWTKYITVYKNRTTYISVKSNKPKDISGYLNDRRDGKRYKIVKIGNQVWMAENLAYKTASRSWAYDNNLNNVPKYGYLYDRKTAKKVCPSGWRLPSNTDFKELLNNYDGEGKSAYSALISKNYSSFSAPLSGWRNSRGSYGDAYENAYFWTSSTRGETTGSGYVFAIRRNDKGVGISYRRTDNCGFSVRCIQNN